MSDTDRWIALDGADNVRDLGGLPTADGRSVLPRRVIRADSLQSLTEGDVRHLVDDVGVRAVVDLRTGIEVRGEGPDPMTREPLVDSQHLSLFPASVDTPLDDEVEGDGPVLLPWQERDRTDAAGGTGAERPESSDGASKDSTRRGASAVYLSYLDDRPDSILAALRLIAATDGATIVHCAAGKDRTGVVCAMALTEVGVPRAEVIADYALSAERVPEILTRLASRRTYSGSYSALDNDEIDRHKPRAVTMERFLAAMDAEHGGVGAWLRANGWTDADAARLRSRMLGA